MSVNLCLDSVVVFEHDLAVGYLFTPTNCHMQVEDLTSTCRDSLGWACRRVDIFVFGGFVDFVDSCTSR